MASSGEEVVAHTAFSEKIKIKTIKFQVLGTICTSDCILCRRSWLIATEND